MLIGVGLARSPVHAADLGGEHETVPRLAAQHMPEAQLAFAVAVPGRGVEVADARGMRRLDGGAGLGFRDGLAHVAQVGAPQASWVTGKDVVRIWRCRNGSMALCSLACDGGSIRSGPSRSQTLRAVEIFFKGLGVPPQRFDVLGDFLRRLLDLLASAYVHLFAVAGTADCPSTKQQTT